MKAQAFLDLVSEMMTAQQDYFKARKGGKLDTHNMLVKARDLEKKVLAVIDEGSLEPDDPLDFPAELRPTEDITAIAGGTSAVGDEEPKQGNLFDKESDIHETQK